MPVAILNRNRIQDQLDFGSTPGAGNTGYYVQWNNTSGKFELAALGTMATQAANNVSITGGSITGITDLAIADGGTGASTAADARTNLGLVAAGAGDIWVEKAGDTMTGDLTINRESATASVYLISTGGSGRSWRFFSGTDGAFGIYDNTGIARRLAIDANGNSAFATAPPPYSAKLYINQSSSTAAIPVLSLNQADTSEEFVRLTGRAAPATLSQSLVAAGAVTTFTPVGYAKINIQDDGNQIADGFYYVQFGVLS